MFHTQKDHLSYIFSYSIRIPQTRRREISDGVCAKQFLLFDVSALCYLACFTLLFMRVDQHIYRTSIVYTLCLTLQMMSVVLKQTQMNK